MGVFTGKTAVVAGASSGIGRAVALRLSDPE
jgi:NAD(P)-dependent dehydrogenase (short-subunit alcohol dehydrogenase family)